MSDRTGSTTTVGAPIQWTSKVERVVQLGGQDYLRCKYNGRIIELKVIKGGYKLVVDARAADDLWAFLNEARFWRDVTLAAE